MQKFVLTISWATCLALLAVTMLSMTSCSNNPDADPKHYYVDLPEEIPAKGDWLEVYKISGDTMYLGYVE